ncbi:MAG TPA: glycosyltransferase family 39 protein [Thermoanaerobaculia bacterium]
MTIVATFDQTTASSHDPDSTSWRFGRSWRTVLCALVLLTWTLRLLLLFVPLMPLADELRAFEAGQQSVATEFVTTGNWGERWHIQEKYSMGGRILWIVSHLLWGHLTAGASPLAVPLIAGLVAAIALWRSAARLYGDDAGLLMLTLTSLSPLFLNYSASLRGTMHSVVWLSLALLLFTGPATSLMRWIGGGLCLGLSFTTHYGSGSSIAALAIGLAFSIGARMLAGRFSFRTVLKGGAGVLAAILPLALLQLWSWSGGGSYVHRLRTHENLGFTDMGPHGLWLRKLFELDPLLLAMTILVVVLHLTDRQSVLRRWGAAASAVAIVIVLLVSLRGAPSEAYLRLTFGVGIGAVLLLVGTRGWSSPQRHPASAAVRDEGWILNHEVILVTAAAAFALFTASRSLSGLARLFFPCWPVILLVLVGEMRRFTTLRLMKVIPALVMAGALCYGGGLVALYGFRTVTAAGETYAAEHPGLTRLRYSDFYSVGDRAANFGSIARRRNHEIVILGPSARLYPAVAYDEEEYKVDLMREGVDRFDLQNVLKGEQLPFSEIFVLLD